MRFHGSGSSLQSEHSRLSFIWVHRHPDLDPDVLPDKVNQACLTSCPVDNHFHPLVSIHGWIVRRSVLRRVSFRLLIVVLR